MEFLMDPLEIGSEFDPLKSDVLAAVECDTGYVCRTGTDDPDKPAN